MSVPLLFFGWIRDKKLEINNKNILDSVVIRSSINSRMLDSQSQILTQKRDIPKQSPIIFLPLLYNFFLYRVARNNQQTKRVKITHLFGMSSTCKPAISTSTTLNQTMPLRFFASSRTLYSLENTLPSKLWPNKFLMSYSGKKFQRCHCHKKLPSLLSSQQHFAGIFASEPMTLPEIDHVSFFAEHA